MLCVIQLPEKRIVFKPEYLFDLKLFTCKDIFVIAILPRADIESYKRIPPLYDNSVYTSFSIFTLRISI